MNLLTNSAPRWSTPWYPGISLWTSPVLPVPGNRIFLRQFEKAAIGVGKTIAILSPTDASVKDLRKAKFEARTFQGFQLTPERADLLVIDEASMLSMLQMLWLVKHAKKNDSKPLL